MAERGTESIAEWLEIDIGKLSGQERTGLIFEIMDTLSAQELGIIRTEADRKRQGKLKQARLSFVAEMREKAEQLELTLEEVLGLEEESKKRPKRAASPKAKYRSPDGQEWSGRGRAAKWLLDLEAQGRSRDEFLIKDG
jgi:DNA-binding protein H-NS